MARQYGVSDVSIHNLIKKLNAADQSIRSSDLPKPACEAAKIAAENEQRIKAELEDCENGIPNTPLVPRKTQINPEFDAAVDEMIAESKSAITEKNSVNAEPQKIPHVIWCALDDQCSAINLEIETREERIAELQDEIVKLSKMKADIQSWMEEHS